MDAAVLANQLRYYICNGVIPVVGGGSPELHQLAGGALTRCWARDFAPLPERLRNATLRMEKLPALLLQMRENLDPARVPLIHAETVSKQNRGVLTLVDELILPHAGELSGEERKRLDAAIAGLRTAVEASRPG